MLTNEKAALLASAASSPRSDKTNDLNLDRLLSTTPVPAHIEAITMMVFSASKNDVARVKKLINAGMSPDVSDYDNRTPLHVASAEGHLDMVKVLVEAGANFNAKDRWGGTPLDDAIESGGKSASVLEYLKSKGAITGSHTAVSARGASLLDPVSPISALLHFAAEGNVEGIRTLLDEKVVTPDSADYDKRTAFHLAASEGHLDVLKLLIERGGNILCRDRWLNSPYLDAVRSNHLECAKFIEQNGGLDERSNHVMKDNSREEFEKLHARGMAEKWAIEAADYVMDPSPFARGAGGELYKIKWRGLVCVAKTCSNMTTTQVITDLGNEISLMATLRHPYLVLFLGACFQVSPPVLLMEYCDGGTLEQRLIRARDPKNGEYTLPLATRYRFTYELSIAMCFLHKCHPPVVHRDLKPSNVLLSRSETIKVTDFGLSKFIPSKNKTMGDKFVMTGETGSYRYMAPEVFRHESYNMLVDVYSFALISYWIITGIRPFINIQDPVRAVKMAALEELRPSLSPIRGMPKTQAIISKAWAQAANDRPNFEEIVTMLEDAVSEFQPKPISNPFYSCCFPVSRTRAGSTSSATVTRTITTATTSTNTTKI